LIAGTIRSELAIGAKYKERHGLLDFIVAWARLLMAMCAMPLLPLWRDDWRREARFVMADRRARVAGPVGEARWPAQGRVPIS
jgi:hypothetical protein